MADEVSTGELYRGLQEIKAIVVSHGEYEEFKRHTLHRLAEHDREIEGERQARETAVEKIHTERAATRQANRAAFMACVGGIIAALLVAAVSAWVTGKGGH